MDIALIIQTAAVILAWETMKWIDRKWISRRVEER